MSGVVISATAAYLALAVRVFTDDKRSLIYELNASIVKTLAAQVEATLQRSLDKVRLLGQGRSLEGESARSLLASEPDLVHVAVYKNSGGEWKASSRLVSEPYLNLYGLKAQAFEELRKAFPIPFEKVLSRELILLNVSQQALGPLVTVVLASSPDTVIAAELKMDRVIRLLGEKGIVQAFIVGPDGAVLAHPEASVMTSHASMGEIPIVQDAVESKLTSQLREYDWSGERWIGGFAHVGVGGALVIAQVPARQAFRAAAQLIEKSLLFALAVITAALLISSWVAGTFTEPLKKLLHATERLAKWEGFRGINVRTRDEIGHLARAFNAMASDLEAQRAQIDANQKELEIKVKERTSAIEQQKQHLADSQEGLVRTTKLAALGEVAGAAAHEVLNPMNNMNIRLERISRAMAGPEAEDLKLMDDIANAWAGKLKEGGWPLLLEDLKRPTSDGKRSLGEEDIENLLAIIGDEKKRRGERRKDIEFLATEITRVTRIVNGMRALSRVGGERRPLDIHQPLEDTFNALVDQADKKGVKLVKDFSSQQHDAFTVIGDRDEMVQIFSNLVRNSIHAVVSANKRTGEVRLQTRVLEGRVEIRIRDNGVGISAANRGKIFESNFTTKSVEEGTGLGLSISRRIVRAFGGDLELEKSAEGEGATFLVWFPKAS